MTFDEAKEVREAFEEYFWKEYPIEGHVRFSGEVILGVLDYISKLENELGY